MAELTDRGVEAARAATRAARFAGSPLWTHKQALRADRASNQPFPANGPAGSGVLTAARVPTSPVGNIRQLGSVEGALHA